MMKKIAYKSNLTLVLTEIELIIKILFPPPLQLFAFHEISLQRKLERTLLPCLYFNLK